MRSSNTKSVIAKPKPHAHLPCFVAHLATCTWEDFAIAQSVHGRFAHAISNTAVAADGSQTAYAFGGIGVQADLSDVVAIKVSYSTN